MFTGTVSVILRQQCLIYNKKHTQSLWVSLKNLKWTCKTKLSNWTQSCWSFWIVLKNISKLYYVKVCFIEICNIFILKKIKKRSFLHRFFCCFFNVVFLHLYLLGSTFYPERKNIDKKDPKKIFNGRHIFWKQDPEIDF